MIKVIFTVIILSAAITQSIAQKGYDTVKVYFPINITQLNPQAINTLDSTAKIIQKRSLLIYGYADYLGNEPANMDLARNRAKNVKQYLIDHKINSEQILICEGIGQVNRNVKNDKDGYPEDRSVLIFIKREPAVEKITPAQATAGRKMRVAEFTSNGKLVAIKPEPKKMVVTELPKPAVKQTKKPLNNSDFSVLNDLKPNEVLRIESIHFQPTRHLIIASSEPVLIQLVETLKKFPDLAIRIEGHVCCIKSGIDALDTDTYELKLSVNRAKFIYEYLIANGIDKSRLEYAGFGKQRPLVAVELTEDDAQRNRRVEIRVLRN